MPMPERLRRLLAECDVETFRGSGPGGQHRNKTESAVRLTHRETGIVRTASEERSQYRNRVRALERMEAALEARRRKPVPRIATRATAASKSARLEHKRREAVKKAARRAPGVDE